MSSGVSSLVMFGGACQEECVAIAGVVGLGSGRGGPVSHRSLDRRDNAVSIWGHSYGQHVQLEQCY